MSYRMSLFAMLTLVLVPSVPDRSRADESSRPSSSMEMRESQQRKDLASSEESDTASRNLEQESSASSQTSMSDFFDDAHRQQLYREGRLTYKRATLWTLALPGLGNFYAKQYLIGGIAASMMGFAALLVSYGLATQQSGFIWSGLGTAGSAYLGGMISSYFGVRAYNRRLRSRLRLSSNAPGLEPPRTRGISLTVFQF